MLVPIVIFGRKGKTINFGNYSLRPGDLGSLGRIPFTNVKGHWISIYVPRLGPKCLVPMDTKQLNVCFISRSPSTDILKAFDKFSCSSIG